MHKTILIMPINRETLHEMVRFGVVGVVATALHYGVYWLLHAVTDVNLAYTIGYAVSFVANYLLSARFTFRRKKTVANGLGFCAAHLFNYLLQLALLNLFIRLGVGAGPRAGVLRGRARQLHRREDGLQALGRVSFRPEAFRRLLLTVSACLRHVCLKAAFRAAKGRLSKGKRPCVEGWNDAV